MPYSRFSLTPYVLALAILIGTGYYGYQKYTVLQQVKNQIKANVVSKAEAETTLASVMDAYGQTQAEALANGQKRANEIELIFPSTEDITTLMREFDLFFTKNNFTNSPLFLSNLTFGAPLNHEEWDYTILPVKMNIQSSEDNFYKFLNYIENSGSFQNQLRLMSIKTININFNKEQTSEVTSAEVKVLDYNVDINAYFKKQIEKPKGDNSI